MLKYINQLALLFEHQPTTAVGAEDGVYTAFMTDTRMLLKEKTAAPAAADAPMAFGKCAGLDAITEVNDVQFAEGAFKFKSEELFDSKETLNAVNKPSMTIDKLLKGMESVAAKMTIINFPATFKAISDAWLAIHIVDGELRMRSADSHDALATSMEVAISKCKLEGEFAFSVPTKLITVCLENSDKVVASFKEQNGIYYFRVMTPEFEGAYACKPLILETEEEETVRKTEEDVTTLAAAMPAGEGTDQATADNAMADDDASRSTGGHTATTATDENSGDPGNAETEEPVAETSEQVEEGSQEGETSEETGESGVSETGEDPAPPPKKAEDVDPLEALDVLMPELIRNTKQTVHANLVELEKYRKNVAKQARKALKAKADAGETAELKKQLAAETKRANKAEAELAKLKGSLSALKGII